MRKTFNSLSFDLISDEHTDRQETKLDYKAIKTPGCGLALVLGDMSNGGKNSLDIIAEIADAHEHVVFIRAEKNATTWTRPVTSRKTSPSRNGMPRCGRPAPTGPGPGNQGRGGRQSLSPRYMLQRLSGPTCIKSGCSVCALWNSRRMLRARPALSPVTRTLSTARPAKHE